jgi:hypothetical protein
MFGRAEIGIDSRGDCTAASMTEDNQQVDRFVKGMKGIFDAAQAFIGQHVPGHLHDELLVGSGTE